MNLFLFLFTFCLCSMILQKPLTVFVIFLLSTFVHSLHSRFALFIPFFALFVEGTISISKLYPSCESWVVWSIVPVPVSIPIPPMSILRRHNIVSFSPFWVPNVKWSCRCVVSRPRLEFSFIFAFFSLFENLKWSQLVLLCSIKHPTSNPLMGILILRSLSVGNFICKTFLLVLSTQMVFMFFINWTIFIIKRLFTILFFGLFLFFLLF